LHLLFASQGGHKDRCKGPPALSMAHGRAGDSDMEFSESLKKYGDFQRVYKKGKSYANKYLVMYVLKQGTQENHIGISVSKKVGNSVVRHRITRLIRESYRLNEAAFEKGLDVVVVARPAIKDRSFSEVESSLLHLGRLHKICAVWRGEPHGRAGTLSS